MDPPQTTNKTPNGWLVIREINPYKEEADPHRIYVEKCDNEYKRLRQILHTPNNIRDYLIKNGTKPSHNFLNEQSKLDIYAFFKENWEMVDINNVYGYQVQQVRLGIDAVDEALCNIYHDMQQNADINIDAAISGGLSLYEMKKKTKKKHKIACPHCGNLIRRGNLSRHIKSNCKVIKQQSS